NSASRREPSVAPFASTDSTSSLRPMSGPLKSVRVDGRATGDRRHGSYRGVHRAIRGDLGMRRACWSSQPITPVLLSMASRGARSRPCGPAAPIDSCAAACGAGTGQSRPDPTGAALMTQSDKSSNDTAAVAATNPTSSFSLEQYYREKLANVRQQLPEVARQLK